MRLLLSLITFCVFFVGCNSPSSKFCSQYLSTLKFVLTEHVLYLDNKTDVDQLQIDVFSKVLKSFHLPPNTTCENLVSNLPQFKNELELFEAMMEMTLKQLDPYSNIFKNSEFLESRQIQGRYGFKVDHFTQNPQGGSFSNLGSLEITDVIAGSPAHQVGLKEGMIIEKLNGAPVQSISRDTFLKILSKEKKIRLQIGTATYSLEAFPFDIPAMKFETYANGISYFKIRHFEESIGSVREILKTLRASSSQLILDLRDNWGGELENAFKIGSELSFGGEFIHLMKMNEKNGLNTKSLSLGDRESTWKPNEIVVLVNSRTKSAAEALAASLQDQGALVIGRSTFGKGTVTRLYSLKEKSGYDVWIQLSHLLMVRPNGNLIEAKGILPQLYLAGESNPSRKPWPRFAEKQTYFSNLALKAFSSKSAAHYSSKIRHLQNEITNEYETGSIKEDPKQDSELELVKKITYLSR